MSEGDSQQHSFLVTGGSGFIGSHVAIHLAKSYPESRVCVLDKLTYCTSRHNLDEASALTNFKFIRGDICSTETVLKIFREEQIDTIFHFAAETHVDNSFGNSFEFTRTNVFGTHVLLECARMHQDKIHRFIHVSTDEVYGTSQLDDTEPKKETDAFAPSNPYAAAKCGADSLCQSYYHSWKLPIIITRSNNVYGPHQYPEKLIPKFISLLDQDRPVPIYGNGQNKRAWIYVRDITRAYDTIFQRGVVGEIYNIASPYEMSNLDLTRMLLEVMEKDPEKYLSFVTDRPGHDLRYFSDGSKMAALGWQPETDFATGLRSTIAWYRSHPRHWDEAQMDDCLLAEAFKRKTPAETSTTERSFVSDCVPEEPQGEVGDSS